jgi:prephenate dehydrogenase
MKRWDTVAIVGVGLIGGSVGRALLARGLAGRVIGIGRRASTLRKARQLGAVSETTTRLAQGVAEAQLVIVCTPVDSVVPLVREAAAACPPGCLLTDAGSTKARIVAELDAGLDQGVAFVGSHPLAGSDRSGPEWARDDLFQDRVVVITPTARTRVRDVARIRAFWRALGAGVVAMSPRRHDETVAATSHAPHVLAALLAGATPRRYLPLVASGWLDTTRVAGGDVETWTQILQQNRAAVLKSLDKFAKVLDAMRRALAEDDRPAIAGLLEAGKRNRDAVGN